MFNSKWQKTLDSHTIRLESLMDAVIGLRDRVKNLEEKPPIVGLVKVNKPFGYKFYFNFTNPDGSLNGGFFTDPKALGGILELVYSMGGRDFVVRDQTITTESPAGILIN